VSIGQDRKEILEHLKTAFRMSQLQVAELDALLEDARSGSTSILASIRAFQPDFDPATVDVEDTSPIKAEKPPKKAPATMTRQKLKQQMNEPAAQPAVEKRKESFRDKALKILSEQHLSAAEVCGLLFKKVDNHRGEFTDMLRVGLLGYTERKVGPTKNTEKVYASIEWFEKSGIKEYYIHKDGKNILVK
jgi:site-specific recombinase XerC